jgi:predicted dehydrogenase
MIGVAVVGCGKAGTMHLAAYNTHPAARVVAVSDTDAQRAQSSALQHGAVVASVEEIASNPRIALVSLCGPTSTRLGHALALAPAGKNLLAEKPLAPTLADGLQILDAATLGVAPVHVNFNMRFHPVAEAIAAIIRRHGPPDHVDIRYTYDRLRSGRRPEGVGVLNEQGSHPLDLLLGWIGPVEDVTAHLRSLTGGPEDEAKLDLVFTSGATASLFASYGHPGPEGMKGRLSARTYKIDFVLSPYDPDRNVVTFEQAGIANSVELRRPDQINPVYPGLLDAPMRTVEAVVEACQERTMSPAPIEDAIAVLRVVDAAHRSARSGKAISPSAPAAVAC